MNAVLRGDVHRATDIRPEYERARRAIKAELATLGPVEAALRLAELAAMLDQRVERIKVDLLATSLCWSEQQLALVAWIHSEHHELFAMAHAIAERAGGHEDHAVRLRLPAAGLYHWGEAMKWGTRGHRRDFQALHALMAAALRDGSEREPLRLLAAGRERIATLEALYFRSLLLDRFGGGSLTPPQLEILDAWLWEWLPALQARRQAPETRCFHVDLDSNGGLREGEAEPGRNALYLPVDGLLKCRREVVAQFHRGHLVPRHGCAAEMRIEEHVAVLEQTGRAFEAIGAHEARARRRPGARVRVEAWVGPREILAKGLPARAGNGAAKVAEQVLCAMAAGGASRPGGALADDPSRRYLWLNDESESGFGFEALSNDALGIEVGDLLGWRKGPHQPCAIGRVARRMPGGSPGQVYLGVELLTAAAQSVRLSEIAGERELAEEDYIYVPGDDDGGRRDAFLVPESRYHDGTLYQACVEDRLFRLRMDRLRQRGRGWVLAGFELQAEFAPVPRLPDVPDRATAVAVAAQADDDAALEEALAREMGSRLLG